MTICYIKTKDDMQEAEYIGVYQVSGIIPPSTLQGGHEGGVSAYPVAVVKMGDRLKQVLISDVVFQEG